MARRWHRARLLILILVGWGVTAEAQDLSQGRGWGLGLQLIPATSFEVEGFSFPTLTLSVRYWGERGFGIEGAWTFGLKRAGRQTPGLRFEATWQVKGLYKFAETEGVGFYLSSGVVARYRADRFSLPALRVDVGAEFSANPNDATSWEFGYGFRLMGEGGVLDRLTTGVGWARHFYPTRRTGGGR